MVFLVVRSGWMNFFMYNEVYPLRDNEKAIGLAMEKHFINSFLKI